jgi:ornithine cyclodeaminase/alanine dehydrogenase-like protein (mu-crystallin family)
MQVYNRDAVARSLPYGALIDAIEKAFRKDAVVPDRVHHRVEVPGGADATLLMMPAWRRGEFLGVKVATIHPGNTAMNLSSVNASYLLLNAGTGEPVAILDGTELTLRRTGASSALASKYLSRQDAAVFLMVGTGKLAPHLVSAHAAVRRLDEVMIWGRRSGAAAELAATLAPASFALTAVDDLEDAVSCADIICCATLATEPLIRGKWLRPGQHLDLVGAFRPDMSEADTDAILRAQVYVDTLAGATAEAGEIVQAMQSGRFGRGDIVGDLFSLVRGACPGRESADAMTLFKSVGTALEDLAAAELATTGAT